MATTLLTCRVCGKEYQGCRTAATQNGVFQWRRVACSPECGEIYLSKIRESRGEVIKHDDAKPVKKEPRKIRKKPVEAEIEAPVVDAVVDTTMEDVDI